MGEVKTVFKLFRIQTLNNLTFSTLLLLVSLFVFAQETPDYNKPYAPIFFDKPIYSWTDKVKIQIIAPSWNTDKYLIDSIGDDEHNPIKISTRGYSLEPYRLTETDVNSGIFTGEVILTGFAHDADGDGVSDTTPRTLGNGPTSGFIETQRDSAITVSFEFADGVVLSESVPIRWNQGIISFSKENYLFDEGVIVRVVDLDMNLNPESLDHIPVEISSDSDTAGVKVELIETAEDSGAFEAVVSLSQNPSSGNRLFALLGDNIYAKYQDYTLPEPHSTSDNLAVEVIAKIISSVPMLGLTNSQITLTDRLANPLETYSLNNQIQIVGTLINEQAFKQKFTYLFQIEDDENEVVSISWVQGEIGPKQTLEVAQSWQPKELGEYEISTFIWESLVNPVPISKTLSRSFSVR